MGLTLKNSLDRVEVFLDRWMHTRAGIVVLMVFAMLTGIVLAAVIKSGLHPGFAIGLLTVWLTFVCLRGLRPAWRSTGWKPDSSEIRR